LPAIGISISFCALAASRDFFAAPTLRRRTVAHDRRRAAHAMHRVALQPLLLLADAPET